MTDRKDKFARGGRPATEASAAKRQAARENGTKGGRPTLTPEYRDMKRSNAARILYAGDAAISVLMEIMSGKFSRKLDDGTVEVEKVPLDLIERAAGRLVSKLPEHSTIEFEGVVPKLVDVHRYRASTGDMVTVDGVPGPGDVTH